MSKKGEKEKVKKPSEAEGQKAILDFLRRGNRPYSAQMVCDQLKNGLSKVAVEKILASLAEKGSITSKEFGKAKIFWTRQEDLPEVDKDGLSKLEAEIQNLLDENATLQEETKELKGQLTRLTSAPTNAGADAKCEALTTENGALEKKLSELRGGKKLVTAEEKRRIKKSYDHARTEWKKRKAMCMSVLSTVEENIPDKKPRADLMADIGIETDEDAKVSFEALGREP